MSRYLVLMVVAVLLCATTVAFAATTVYTNDFGTAAQQATVTQSYLAGSGVPTNTPITFPEQYWLGSDLDGDTLHSAVDLNYSWALSVVWAPVNAPTGFTISNPTFSYLGNANYWCGQYALMALTANDIATTSGSYVYAGGHGFYGTQAVSASWSSLSTVYVGVYMSNPTGTDYGDGSNPVNANWTLTADLTPIPSVPEPGSVLALGTGLMGLAGFAIRRRK